MSKKNLKKTKELKLVKSVNKNVRSSTRKLKPILKSIVPDPLPRPGRHRVDDGGRGGPVDF